MSPKAQQITRAAIRRARENGVEYRSVTFGFEPTSPACAIGTIRAAGGEAGSLLKPVAEPAVAEVLTAADALVPGPDPDVRWSTPGERLEKSMFDTPLEQRLTTYLGQLEELLA